MRRRSGLTLDFDIAKVQSLYDEASAAARATLAATLAAVANGPPERAR